MPKNKILLIGGQTATGKTKLALHLADKFHGECVSADSRQIYKNMDIGTGKDVPQQSKFKKIQTVYYGNQNYDIGYYIINGIKVWLYDAASVDQDFSIAAYDFLARQVINQISQEKKLPIIVGGTGLYMRTLLNPPETLHVPQNQNLRQELNNLSVDQLQMQLIMRNQSRFNNMNPSDKENPRRLIRAIEVSEWYKDNPNNQKINKPNYDYLFICLSQSKDQLKEKITKRVNHRLDIGFIDEVKDLKLNTIPPNLPATDTLGYQQILRYLQGEINLDECRQQWIQAEVAYAKRQLTYYKKQPDINWFDAGESSIKPEIESLVASWYIEN